MRVGILPRYTSSASAFGHNIQRSRRPQPVSNTISSMVTRSFTLGSDYVHCVADEQIRTDKNGAGMSVGNGPSDSMVNDLSAFNCPAK